MAQPFSEFAGNKRLLWVAEEWQRNADDLAVWAMEHLVNRRDVWGQYTLKSGEVHVVTLPIKERRDTGSDMVTLNKLRRHFNGRAVSHLVGLHVESDHETSKWFAIDVDLHDESIANADEIALANLAACREWANRLRDKLLDPCIVDSNGIGGFHLLVLLDREYPVAEVHEFIAELRSDYEKFGLIRKPELFPSKPKDDNEDRLGNWLRLPGRHHTRPHYSRVWNFDAAGENEWLEGAEAIEAILSLRPAALPLPSDAKSVAKRIASKREPLTQKPRVCVDLDGVLAKYDGFRGRDHIGPPLPGALEFAWSLAKVADIIIFSARCSQDNAGEEKSRLTPAQLRIRVIDWLEKYKFPYTDVYVGQGKPRVAAFIDDRAISCRPQLDSDAFDNALESVRGLLYNRSSRSNGKTSKPNGGQPGEGTKSGIKDQDRGNGLQIPEKDLEHIVKSVREFYREETGELYADEVVFEALNKWLEAQLESEDLEELLTTPHLSEAKAFRKILEETAAATSVPEMKNVEKLAAIDVAAPVFSQRETEEGEEGEENLFNGFRPYSPEKLSAMISYFAAKGKQIYKTKLNKLLFYGDFINFQMHGRSISGANYVHLPFGPVPDQYEYILKKLTSAKQLEITPLKTRKGTANEINLGAKSKTATDALSPEETETLDWVLANYGQMTTEEIMELSHNEKAYRNTHSGEKIAYGYAQFLEILPEKKGKN
jgi:uncharacterized phage-associated protein